MKQNWKKRLLSAGLTMTLLLAGTGTAAFADNGTTWQEAAETAAVVPENTEISEDVRAKLAGESNISSQPVAGERTLRNLLASGFSACGETLYVWGGGWSADDTHAGIDAVTIGTSGTWKAFFEQNAMNYHYRNYLYQNRLGLDCSGFVGWTVYNTLENTNEKSGYVIKSTNMAKTFAEYGFGTYIPNNQITRYQVGDVVSVNGHVYLSLGQCADGSVVVLHSIPESGVQISGTQAWNGDTNSQAYQIASAAMQQYFPYWSSIYTAQCCLNSKYMAGNLMRWDLTNGVLRDPEGLSSMSPEQVISAILGSRASWESYFDTADGAWYCDYVSRVTDNGLMHGMQAGLFAPAVQLTRAQAVQILYNQAGSPQTNGTASFWDVSAESWYVSAVQWAAENGIVQGIGDGSFAPDAAVTREQLAVMLYRYRGAPESSGSLDSFSDAGTVSDWARGAVLWANSIGMMQGTETENGVLLTPTGTATRAQAAKMFAVYFGI